MDNVNAFESTFGYKLIYVFRINDNAHKGIVKIGDATIHYENNIDELKDNCDILNQSAKKGLINILGLQAFIMNYCIQLLL